MPCLPLLGKHAPCRATAGRPPRAIPQRKVRAVSVTSLHAFARETAAPGNSETALDAVAPARETTLRLGDLPGRKPMTMKGADHDDRGTA